MSRYRPIWSLEVKQPLSDPPGQLIAANLDAAGGLVTGEDDCAAAVPPRTETAIKHANAPHSTNSKPRRFP